MSLPAISQNRNDYSVNSIITNTAVGALTGAIAGRIVQTISPSGGAIFGAVAGLTSSVIDYVEKKLKINSIAAQIAFIGIKIFASLAAAHTAINALGFSYTLADSRHLLAVNGLVGIVGTVGLFAIAMVGTFTILGAAAFGDKVFD